MGYKTNDLNKQRNFCIVIKLHFQGTWKFWKPSIVGHRELDLSTFQSKLSKTFLIVSIFGNIEAIIKWM